MKAVICGMLVLMLLLSTPACRLFGSEDSVNFNALETAARETIIARQTQDIVSAAAATAAAQAAEATATQTVMATPLVTATPLPPTVDAPATAAAQAALATAAVATQAASGPAATQTLAMATQASLSATITALVPVQPPFQPPIQPPPPVQPPPPDYPVAGRIRFAPGGTSGGATGMLPPNSRVDYLIAAGAGQTMLASVFSPNNDVFIGVVGVSDGIPLQRIAAGANDFSGQLPATQDYRITLAGPGYSTQYTLEVIIPARIQFAPGAISASIPGRIQAGATNHYLAHARHGQEMTVRVLSPRDDIFLTIYGMTDGSPLVRSMMGQTEWSGTLPLTQDYMIQAVSTGPASNYTLEVIIQ